MSIVEQGTSSGPHMSSSAVRMRNITKAFNRVRVLDNVEFELRRGEVHALLGGNGAGKSTLMKILEGVYVPDSGEIEVNGQPVSIRSTEDAKALGIAMIFQEFSLIPTLTVAQNVFLTREPRNQVGFLNDKESEKRSRQLFAEMGVEIDPRAIVGNLSAGARQLTEIAKALSQKAQVLIMDEPTATLTGSETRSLFGIIQRLKAQGISIIYISHRMEEIFEIADRVTVLRDGRKVVTSEISETTLSKLIEQIVGRKVEKALEWQERHVDRSGQPLLEVTDLTAAPRLRGISVRLYPGEVIGLAGLMGSGRTEFARALFGIDRIERGEIKIRGRSVKIRSPDDATKAGICLIPEDRRAQGLVLDHSVKSNLMLPLLTQLAPRGFVDDRKGHQLSRSLVEQLDIRTDSVFKQTRLLSGGNQQKIVIAKWLAANPEVLIMDEPTAGVDVGAKGEIIMTIRRLANEGKGVIMISSELPELLAVSDRVVVFRDGMVDEELDRKEIQDEKQLQRILHRG